MASNGLLQQFYLMLDQSKSFQILSAVQQDELKKSFANATDEQLRQAMVELDRDAQETAQNERKKMALKKRQAEQAQNLKIQLIQIDKEELKENEAKDISESEKEAESVLASLDRIGDGKPKRKKFLGIF